MGGIPTPEATAAVRLRAVEAGGCAPPVYVEEPINPVKRDEPAQPPPATPEAE